MSTDREDILRALRDARALLASFGVVRLSLFGSSARNEVREDSDVDLLVEFGRPIGLFEFVRLQRELGAIVGRRVELATPAALKPRLKLQICREAIVVWEDSNRPEEDEAGGARQSDAAEAIGQAIEDVKAGRTRPLNEAIEALRQRYEG